MRHIFRISLPIIFLLFSLSASALVVGPIQIVGFVKSFDRKSVIIHNGAVTLKVPRAFVSKDDLKQGKFIKVLLRKQQMLKVTKIK